MTDTYNTVQIINNKFQNKPVQGGREAGHAPTTNRTAADDTVDNPRHSGPWCTVSRPGPSGPTGGRQRPIATIWVDARSTRGTGAALFTAPKISQPNTEWSTSKPAAGQPREPVAAAGENPDMLELDAAAGSGQFEQGSYPGVGSAVVS